MHSFHYLSVTLCALSFLSSQVIGFSGVQSSVHDRSRRLAHVRALSGSDQPRALDISVNQSRDTKISKRDTFTYFQDGKWVRPATQQRPSLIAQPVVPVEVSMVLTTMYVLYPLVTVDHRLTFIQIVAQSSCVSSTVFWLHNPKLKYNEGFCWR